MRVHELRHTGATLAAATGASTAELMHRLGHASPAAALIYQHAAAHRDAEIARTLDALGSGGEVVPIRSRHTKQSAAVCDPLGHVEVTRGPQRIVIMSVACADVLELVQPSKLAMRVRFSSPAPGVTKRPHRLASSVVPSLARQKPTWTPIPAAEVGFWRAQVNVSVRLGHVLSRESAGQGLFAVARALFTP